MEVDLPTALDEGSVEGGVAPAVADVPLARGDDLERLLAALVEIGLALGGRRLAVEVAGLPQRAHDRLTGGVCRGAGELRGIQLRTGAGHPLGGVALESAGAGDDRAHRQLQLTPPDDVGEVAEGAAHRNAGALVGLGGGVGEHWQFDVKQRRPHGCAEQRLVALVVGVGDERHACGDELGSRRLDVDRASGAVERDPVVGAGIVACLEFGLGHGGLESDIPEAGCFG